MKSFPADLFDGRNSRPRAVEVRLAEGRLRIDGEDIHLDVPLDQVRLAPPVGLAREVVFLPDGAELHGGDPAALTELARALPSRTPEHWAHRLEGRIGYAIGALLVSVALIFAGLRWGVPAGAELAARALPAGVETRVGEEALALLDKVSFSPSAVPSARQQAISGRLAALCGRQACPPYRLLFRDGGRIGANAMALPGGTLVLTDGLVRLARHDDELMAVLAHELGHVQRRHSLRLAIQGIGAGAILVAVTGDIGNISDLVAGLPTLLLQSGYSRDMEREADGHALAWLQSACIPPQRFADILKRLDSNPAESHGLLDSHPDTPARLEPFTAAPACPTPSRS